MHTSYKLYSWMGSVSMTPPGEGSLGGSGLVFDKSCGLGWVGPDGEWAGGGISTWFLRIRMEFLTWIVHAWDEIP